MSQRNAFEHGETLLESRLRIAHYDARTRGESPLMAMLRATDDLQDSMPADRDHPLQHWIKIHFIRCTTVSTRYLMVHMRAAAGVMAVVQRDGTHRDCPGCRGGNAAADAALAEGGKP